MVKRLSVNRMQTHRTLYVKFLNNAKVSFSKADNRLNGAVYQKDKPYFPGQKDRENPLERSNTPWL